MKKKFFLTFLTFLIFFNSIILAFPDIGHAFASKVAQKAGSKVVYEVVKNEAENMVFNMVMDYTYKPPTDNQIKKLNTPTSKYTPARHYPKFKNPRKSHAQVCLDLRKKRIKVENEVIEFCEQPLEIKKDLTTQDKKNISNNVEKKLDKATYNKGFNKFLNWFVPIWIVGTTITIAKLVLDNELSTFFSDLAFDSLVDLDLLSNLPVETNVSVEDIEFPQDDIQFDESWKDIGSNEGSFVGFVPKFDLPAGVVVREKTTDSQVGKYDVNRGKVTEFVVNLSSDTPYSYTNNLGKNFTIFDFMNKPILKLHYRLDPVGPMNMPTAYKITRVRMSLGKVDKYSVTDTVVTDITDFDVPYYVSVNRVEIKKDIILSNLEISSLLSLVSSEFSKFTPNNVYVPDPYKTEDVPYTRPNTTITVPSPVSVPAIDITTGTSVSPSPESTPDNIIFIRPDGTVVPEENIDVGDISINPTPDGNVVTNPNPNTNVEEGVIPKPGSKPDPSDPSNPSDPNNPTDPSDPSNPSEPFVCNEKLKKPKFDRLGEEISTTFPFNIPFDLFTSFQNLFIGIGSERPSFKYEMRAFDYSYEVDITIPEIFDEWMPFVRSVILFGFDIGLLFFIFRISGGNK